jgi:SOS-response transcriptional repressor LexA
MEKSAAGSLIVALISGRDIIVKKYYPEGNYVHLLESLSHHHPIILREGDIYQTALFISA